MVYPHSPPYKNPGHVPNDDDDDDDDDVYGAGEDDDNKEQWKPSVVPCAESQVWLDTACC